MKEFDFGQRSQFKVKWGGKEHICTVPSQKQLVEFGKLAKDVEDDGLEIVRLSKEFLEKCGLPQEVYDEMESEQIRMLMDYISAKKN